jgi:hypothetical protein
MSKNTLHFEPVNLRIVQDALMYFAVRAIYQVGYPATVGKHLAHSALLVVDLRIELATP